jgi:1-acyl-sn-glycerol-3-phosphate acyltransferase
MSNDPKKTINKVGIRTRKAIFPIVRLFASTIIPYKLHTVRKADIPKNRPIIYASTHDSVYDAPNAIMLVNNHFYILGGAVEQIFNTFDGVSLWLNGVIVVDRNDKKSRKASLAKMQRAIELGANILICPEATWNLSDSLLVLKLYSGIFELAKRTNALVVPIVTHIEGNNCYAVLDDPFDIATYTKEDGITALRDKMATIRFELLNEFSNFTRYELEADGKILKDTWEKHKKELVSQAMPHHDMNSDYNVYKYKDKNVIEYKEAFAHLDYVKITKDNAFLLRPGRFEITIDR